MNRYARGAVSGAVATLVMTATIETGKRLFRFWTPPPKEITKNVMSQLGMSRTQSRSTASVTWLAAHEAYGMACGMGYVHVRPFMPPSPRAAGLIFGGAVWGVSYLGYLPALDLYPFPEDDRRSRLTVMVIAHAVFGIVLADMEHRLAQHQSRR